MRRKPSAPGLSSRERAVYMSLSDTPTPVGVLAQKTKLPRTSVSDILVRLHSCGLAKPVRVGARTLWKRGSEAKYVQRIQKRLTDRQTVPETSRSASQRLKNASGTVEITLLNTTDEIAAVFERAYTGHPHERTYLTQTPAAVREITKRWEPDLLKKTNQQGKRTKSIVEVLMTTKTKGVHAQYASKNKEWIDSVTSRLLDVTIVPNNVLPNDPSELFIFRDHVLLTDWSNETAILIKNEHLATMLRHLFQATKSLGETFDTNRFIAALAQMTSS